MVVCAELVSEKIREPISISLSLQLDHPFIDTMISAYCPQLVMLLHLEYCTEESVHTNDFLSSYNNRDN